MPRSHDRSASQLRPVSLETGIAPNAQGSVLISFGDTKVVCTAMVEEGVPRWMKEQEVSGGWLTAEYSMLPYSTSGRKPRDITRGRLDGRSVEIQRLIGRSLRAVVDLQALGARTLWVDCDVLQADGGTRTASITGACVAVGLASHVLRREEKIKSPLLKQQVAAVSLGVVEGGLLLDLDYEEDRSAAVDLNLVMTESLEFVELQATGEEAVFGREQLEGLLDMGRAGIGELLRRQAEVLREES